MKTDRRRCGVQGEFTGKPCRSLATRGASYCARHRATHTPTVCAWTSCDRWATVSLADHTRIGLPPLRLCEPHYGTWLNRFPPQLPALRDAYDGTRPPGRHEYG